VVLVQICYFLCSRPADDEALIEAIRRHCSIKNGLHWILDERFNEDRSRVRERAAAQNRAVLRKIALNLLKGDTETPTSMRGRRKGAGWDEAYVARLLTGSLMH